MDNELYQEIVAAMLLEEYDYQKTYLDSLCNKINKAFEENKVSLGCRKNLLRVLIYLFGVKENKWMHRETNFGAFPALHVFNHVTSDMNQEEILSLLQDCSDTNVNLLTRVISKSIVELGRE